MTTTPRLWKSQTQVNTSDAPFPGRGGSNFQGDGQIAPLQDGGYVVVWEDDSYTYNPDGPAIVGQRYDPAGNKVGGEVNISQFTGGAEFSPAVTVLSNGNVAVAFVDKFNGDQDIYVRIFDSALNFVRQDNIDNAETKQTFDPSLTAFADGSYVVSYTLGSGADTDIVARCVSAAGVVGAEFDIDNQTDNRHLSELATLSNGNFVAVYQDEVAGNLANTDILFKVFTPAGAPVAGAVGIVPGAGGPGQEIEPDVAALRGGGFVVVWSDHDSAEPKDIRASILSNETQVVASNILVNTTTAGYQLAPSALALADGGFLVTWTDQNVNLARAQRFDANGSKIGAEFSLNMGDADPKATLLNDGRIAFSVGDLSTGDREVTTAIWTTAGLNGTPLADVLNGSAGPDIMSGGFGNDDYYVYEASDAVVENAGEGMDRVLAFTHFSLPDNVENLDLLGVADLQGYGNGLANVINGNAGNNLIDGRAGADSMKGGLGNDVYFVDNADDHVTENAGEGNDTVYASAHFRLSANVENLILQGGADLQGYGNALVNALYGNSGNNIVNGNGGADVMRGGAGNDAYFVDDVFDQMIENAGEGNDTVYATVHLGLSANVENLILQGGADLQGYGNALVNALYGNGGNNLLNGNGGADVMVGGLGNDAYFVDDGNDLVIENPGEGNDTVYATVHLGLSANVENLILQGNADLQGYGNALVNALYGNSGNNLLNGNGGVDTMRGGAGNDAYFVDDGFDQVIENAGEGNDTIYASVHFVLPANVDNLVQQGSFDLGGTGNALVNGIFGNSGNDTLDGQGGADVLTGNAGNDTFVFNVGQGNGDTVVDFAGNGAAAGDSLQFVGYGAGATFTNVDATHWQVNYNGGTSHDVIMFMNGAAIDAADFLFV